MNDRDYNKCIDFAKAIVMMIEKEKDQEIIDLLGAISISFSDLFNELESD